MELPTRLPLTGADCFLRAFDWQTRRRNRASHLSQLVLELGSGFDAKQFESVLGELVRACPILRAPIRRPVFGAPVYRLDLAASAPMPHVAVHSPATPRAANGTPRVFFERLNSTFALRRGELLAVDIVPRADGTDLALTWAHMLMDGAGSENFLTHLAGVADGERDPRDLPADEWSRDTGLAAALTEEGFRRRGERARAWQAHRASLAASPPRSLGGPLRSGPQQLRFELDVFSSNETRRALELAADRAGFLTPMLFYLAAAIRAHAEVLRARGVVPESFVVPLPVNVRPKGAGGALFRTRVSMLWFQVLPEHVQTLGGLIDELKAQRHELIKQCAVENGIAAMDMARYAPMPVYARMARRSFGGELCSFFFAYTGEFAPDVERLCGARVLNGYHTPSVPASPGSGIILCLRGGRLNAVHVYQQGAVSDDEVARLRAGLRRDLLAPEVSE
ncbi:MAG: hypothetical protein VX681_14535 [Myxococcota bacterium]|nr:hypothetical protein [Myxococcota bacterium]